MGNIFSFVRRKPVKDAFTQTNDKKLCVGQPGAAYDVIHLRDDPCTNLRLVTLGFGCLDIPSCFEVFGCLQARSETNDLWPNAIVVYFRGNELDERINPHWPVDDHFEYCVCMESGTLYLEDVPSTGLYEIACGGKRYYTLSDIQFIRKPSNDIYENCGSAVDRKDS